MKGTRVVLATPLESFCACLIICIVLVSLTCTSARADEYYPNNAIINYHTSAGDAIVGQDGMGNNSSPTVGLIDGGYVSVNAQIYNSSVFNGNGGIVGNWLIAHNASNVTLSGSYLNSSIYALDNSTVNVVSNGDIVNYVSSGNILVENKSTFNMFGGNIGGGLYIYDNGTANISGGIINGGWYVNGSGALDVFGTGLSDILVNPSVSGLSQFTLFGKLADGSNVTGDSLYVQNGGSETVTFTSISDSTPEPGALTMAFAGCAAGFGMFLRRKRPQYAGLVTDHTTIT